MSEQFIHLSNHAKEQAWKRYRLNEDNLLELAHKAVMYGYSINDAPNKQIKKYLLLKQKQGTIVYVYSGYLFIFSKGFLLITTWRMPHGHLVSLHSKKTRKGYG